SRPGSYPPTWIPLLPPEQDMFAVGELPATFYKVHRFLLAGTTDRCRLHGIASHAYLCFLRPYTTGQHVSRQSAQVLLSSAQALDCAARHPDRNPTGRWRLPSP